jgi:hypothetical protein
MRFCLKLFEFKKKLIHFFDFFNFNQLDTRLNKDSSEVNKIKEKIAIIEGISSSRFH